MYVIVIFGVVGDGCIVRIGVGLEGGFIGCWVIGRSIIGLGFIGFFISITVVVTVIAVIVIVIFIVVVVVAISIIASV